MRGHAPRVRQKYNRQTGAKAIEQDDEAIIINTEKMINMIVESTITGVTAIVISKAISDANS